MEYLKRKLDEQLNIWKRRQNHFPLLLTGANQTGKTSSTLHFVEHNYTNVIHIPFGHEPHYKDIFANGNDTSSILKLISLRNPRQELKDKETLIFFDEIEHFSDVCKCFKAFKEDGRYDIIAAGNLSNEEIQEIRTKSDNNLEHMTVDTLNFEEYLWAKGYKNSQIELYFDHIINNFPLSPIEIDVLTENFNEYILTGGFPEVILNVLDDTNTENTIEILNSIYSRCKDSIRAINKPKKAEKIINVLDSIPMFLSDKYKKFQVCKAIDGARNREYTAIYDWLQKKGYVNYCSAMTSPTYPIKENVNQGSFKLYMSDIGLLIASLNDETKQDLYENKNYKTANMALYESFVANELSRQGYDLSFYRNEKGTIEVEFIITDSSSLVPIEVKSLRKASASLKNLINKNEFLDVRYGIKLSESNIDFNGQYYTIPYALSFMIKRFINEMGY